VFTGHAALAVIGKRVRPTVPLAVLLAASYGADAIDVGMRAAGYPTLKAIGISHSLVMVAAAAALAGLAYGLVRRDLGGALVVFSVYLAHWPADLLTGLYKPIWPGSPYHGFGLYHIPLADFALEGALLVSLYFVARRYIRPYFIVILLIIQLLFNIGVSTEHPGLKRQMLDGLSHGDHLRERLSG
jgi:hypothetical protein